MITKLQKELKEKAANKAASLKKQAATMTDSAMRELDGIPPGQPILVGHHSERHHRAAIARHDRKMRKACDTIDHANAAEWAVANSGNAILSRDPQAIEALEEKLKRLLETRETYKAINKAWKHGKEEGLRKAGYLEETISKISADMAFFHYKRKPFDTTNIGARIRATKKRIEELKAAKTTDEISYQGEGFSFESDKADMRIRFYFDEKPGKVACKIMRNHGFKFSRTAMAWQRHLNPQGERACIEVARILFGDVINPNDIE